MFTGSTAVGRQLTEQCGKAADRLLHGTRRKNAMLVLADANLDKAAEIAVRACFSNSGQLCISMGRMYINEKIYDAFVEVRGPGPGDAHNAEVGWGADMGSLISRSSSTPSPNMSMTLAKAATAGSATRPTGHRTAVLPAHGAPKRVTRHDRLHHQRRSGRWSVCTRCRTTKKPSTRPSDTEWSNASVLTATPSTGARWPRGSRPGRSTSAEGYGSAWGTTSAPMGGMGASGIGRRHGTEACTKYTESQPWPCNDWSTWDRSSG